MTNLDLDERRVGEFVERALGVLVGGATAQMVYLGDRLGLYQELETGGAATPAELATQDRVCRALSRRVAGTAVVGRVRQLRRSLRPVQLPVEHAPVLAADDSPITLVGRFRGDDRLAHGYRRLVEAFRSGEGVSWPATMIACSVACLASSARRTSPLGQRMDSVARPGALAAPGRQVADVGCGPG